MSALLFAALAAPVVGAFEYRCERAFAMYPLLALAAARPALDNPGALTAVVDEPPVLVDRAWDWSMRGLFRLFADTAWPPFVPRAT